LVVGGNGGVTRRRHRTRRRPPRLFRTRALRRGIDSLWWRGRWKPLRVWQRWLLRRIGRRRYPRLSTIGPAGVGWRRHREWLIRGGAGPRHLAGWRRSHHRCARIRVGARWDERELVGRQGVKAIRYRGAVRDRRSAPRVGADWHIAARIAAERHGWCPLARELLARVVARTAHGGGIVLSHLAIHIGRDFP